MNKKAYLVPETNTINIEVEATILAGSNLGDDPSGFSLSDIPESPGGLTAGARHTSLWDDVWNDDEE